MASKSRHHGSILPQPTDYAAKLIFQLRKQNQLLKKKIQQLKGFQYGKFNNYITTTKEQTFRANPKDDIEQIFCKKFIDLHERRNSKSSKKSSRKSFKANTQQSIFLKKEKQNLQIKKTKHSKNKSYLESPQKNSKVELRQISTNILQTESSSYFSSNAYHEEIFNLKIDKNRKRLSNNVYIQEAEE